jgi:Fe-Mn family superoxide dismutase
MNTLEQKINLITEKLEKIDIEKNKNLFLTEMKKIGIEKLPYSYSSLKQFIDAETMSYHYNKHYKGYVEKLNDALKKSNQGDVELEEIIKSISKYNKTIRNNAGGAFNHALFWKMLTPSPQKPSGKVYSKIIKQFGSFSEFKTKFEEIAKQRFGSGWVWLVLTKRNTLKIVTTPNQDNPLMNVIKNGGYPLLGLDLWEHAYYLKYRNKRDEYIKNFWKCVNWKFVEELYSMKMKTKLNESVGIKILLNESKDLVCTGKEVEEIRTLFNTNPSVKDLYKNSINQILKVVLSKHYYDRGKYSPDSASGIYDLENNGRSVINKLNTNYSCFCQLKKDINVVITKMGKSPIDFTNKSNTDQVNECQRFVNALNYFKTRIFDTSSSTFEKLMKILNTTNSWGDFREVYVVEKLKEIFGQDKVTKTGDLGSMKDMIGGVDCEVVTSSGLKTGQIKPFQNVKDDGNNMTIYGSGSVTPYKTDWIIFMNNQNKILVFKNDNTKIVNGNFVFPKNDLIYTLV